MSEAKAGDVVEVITKEETISGILMPRPELLDENFIVLKLDSGYNIGIDKKKIEKIKVIEVYKAKKAVKEKVKFNKNLPTVAVLSTGGTISSRIDYRTGGVYADYTAEDFVEMMPELKNIANIKAKKIMSVMSEDLMPADWKQMAHEIAKELNDNNVSGVVITHGTDTLHYTAAALSFLLRNLNKPVVITGAQRSIDRGSSDAFMNLVCSITTAAKMNMAEVITCLHGSLSDDYCVLNRGTKVRKMHTSRRDAFRPINELPIAKVYDTGKIEILNEKYKKKTNGKVIVDDKFEEKIALVQIYPGMDPGIIDFYVKKGYKGIILTATALGHVPTMSKNSLISVLKKAIDKKVAVVIASQTLYGRTHPYVYTNLRKLSVEAGCIFAEDMLPETAYVKLGWVLGHTNDLAQIKKLMLENVAGEITHRIMPDSFLY